MLQNMPTVEYIARTLNMEHPNVQSLLQSGSPQGRSYLAQQLTQRGAIPGGGLGQTAAQQPAGGALASAHLHHCCTPHHQPSVSHHAADDNMLTTTNFTLL